MDNELLSNRSRERAANYKPSRTTGPHNSLPHRASTSPTTLTNLTPAQMSDPLNTTAPPETAPAAENGKSNLMMYLAIGGGILTLGAIGYLVYKNKKLNETNAELIGHLNDNMQQQRQPQVRMSPPQTKQQTQMPLPQQKAHMQFVPARQQNIDMDDEPEHAPPSIQQPTVSTKMYTDIYNELQDMELDEMEADQHSVDENDDVEDD